jgi:hypothetical protein
MKENIFGGFTPVELESDRSLKADDSLKSFLFTLKNPHNIPAMKFPLKAKEKSLAINCMFNHCPVFYDIGVSDNCNVNTDSWASVGSAYTNNTGMNGGTLFTGSYRFQVKEIEVFDITD